MLLGHTWPFSWIISGSALRNSFWWCPEWYMGWQGLKDWIWVDQVQGKHPTNCTISLAPIISMCLLMFCCWNISLACLVFLSWLSFLDCSPHQGHRLDYLALEVVLDVTLGGDGIPPSGAVLRTELVASSMQGRHCNTVLQSWTKTALKRKYVSWATPVMLRNNHGYS